MSRIKYYTVKLKTVGPLFVGSGEMLEKSEYVINLKNGRIYVIDRLKLFKGLLELGLLNEYELKVMDPKYQMDLFRFFKEHNLLGKYEEWVKYSYCIDDTKDMKGTQIMTCIKDPYLMPYIPGTSLKGSLRNALLNYELSENNDRYKTIASRVQREQFKGRRNYLRQITEDLEVTAGFNRAGSDKKKLTKFSGLRISDSKPLSLNDIILCRKIDVLPNGSKRKLPLQRECIKPGTEIEFTMEIDSGYGEDYFFEYSEKTILKAIHLMYNNIVEKFLYAFPDVTNYMGNLIYVGGGSGYITKTALYSLYSDRKTAVNTASIVLDNVDSKKPRSQQKMGNHLLDPSKYKVSPHTRKCTVYKNKLYDFGLCEINFEPIG